MQDAYAVSERTACDAGGVARSSVRYASVAAPQEPLRQRLRELAQTRVAYGYRRLHVLLCREGWPVNHKRIQRLYRDEGLTQQRTRPKRRRSAAPRVARMIPGAANERWAMDFMYDQLADGAAFRVLSMVESFHNSFRRECLTQHYFIDITDAQQQIEQYRSEYNNDRPHSSLGNVPPAHFRATVATTASVSTTA